MEAIGQLTAGLAHDFNNLLQIVTGNLETAAQRAGNDPVLLEAIEHASEAAMKGGRLTQQLLTFARKQRLDPKRVNLNSLIVEFSDMLVRTLGTKVDLRLDLKPGLPHCILDTIHMEMALLNVLINARDAMPKGGKVTIGTSVIQDKEKIASHHLPPGTYIVLCIIDEGAGMAPEVVRRATEPFFTTKELGTGPGLAMVHGFVQQSHGRLEIASEVGRGTNVRMIFPAAVDRLAPEPSQGEDGLRAATPKESRTILLVEDSDDVRQVADQFLRLLGYHVLAASRGEEALKVLDEQGKIDLLFTDILMPGGINGLVLADRIRQRVPSLPVLFTTGYMEDLASYGGTLPGNVLSKPYKRTELAERVRLALVQNNENSVQTSGDPGQDKR